MEKCFTRKNKLAKVMKICAIQAIICTTLCSLAVAHYNYAQVLDKKVTLTLREVSIEEALGSIASVADVKFFYSVDQLDIRDKVSFEAINRSLRNLLDDLFSPYHVKYNVHEKKSIITLKKQHHEIGSDARVVGKEDFGIAALDPFATVSGTVRDAVTQQPVAGVNIIVKGTTEGTTTNSEGNFSIRADDEDILVFSFIGYSTFEIQVNGQAIIDVLLQVEVKNLDEVVVNAGYWQVTNKESTGNISRITSEELSQQPVPNSMAALIGRMPGVFIQQGSGLAGGGFGVEIRGRNSVRADGNNPLYLINGVPFPGNTLSQLGGAVIPASNPLNAISPGDIESIEILKDADATAIYGSRGANGVVIITTKKGKKGGTTFDFNVGTGVSTIDTDRLKMLSTGQYLQMRREAIVNDGYSALLTNPAYNSFWPDLNVWDTTRYTDWREMLIGETSYTSNGQASVSGGNANTQFFFSGNYWKETTVFPGDFGFRRGSGHLNFSHTDDKGKFNMNLSTTYTVSNNNLPSSDFTTNAFRLPPNAPAVYQEDGKLNWELYNGNSTWDNPFSFMGRTYETKSSNLNTNIALGYNVFPFLKIKANLGYNIIRVDEYQKKLASYLNPADPINSITSLGLADNTVRTWIAEPQLEFQKDLSAGRLTALVGTTFNEIIQEASNLSATGFSSEALIQNVNAATIIDIINANYTQYKYNAVFARLNYNWKEKYILNLTARRDGSSRFGPENQFANFGAVGAAWVFSNEDFVKDGFSFLSFGKIRASYGVTGSDQIGDYRYLDNYEPTFRSYVVGGLQPVRLANPDYGWEVSKKMEVGLEVSFIDDRIVFSSSCYRNRSSNQLVGLPLPIMTGFSDVQFNLPATIQNSGVEFELNTTNVKTSNFSWTSQLNLTIPRSRVVSFLHLEELSDFVLRFVVGQPINTSQRYEFKGLDPATGNYQFLDVNEDGVFNRIDDGKMLVDFGPKYYGGINNRLEFRGFQLDFFLQFTKQMGNDIQWYFNMPGQGNNQPVMVLDRWQRPGDNARYRKFSSFTSSANYLVWQSSDDIVTDISFARLKNIALSFQIPPNWSSKIKIHIGKIYIQGQNLLTFTSYKGLDPETKGISTLPPLRSVTIGLQVSL